ncbi:MAG: hypothetical protein NT062_11080 [Proteobacteria bacterium]|nr:hypothetical protein [Pseudomonadota bacterium]
MSTAENIATAILTNDPLIARSLVQDWLRSAPVFADEPPPATTDLRVRAVAAAVVELLAERAGQPAPHWTATEGCLTSPLFLVDAAQHSPKLRARIERESPAPLRKRNLFAPASYLEQR